MGRSEELNQPRRAIITPAVQELARRRRRLRRCRQYPLEAWYHSAWEREKVIRYLAEVRWMSREEGAGAERLRLGRGIARRFRTGWCLWRGGGMDSGCRGSFRERRWIFVGRVCLFSRPGSASSRVDCWSGIRVV